MKYGSVCSGVEAASVAWEPLGWEPVFFSEVEAFPSAVLAHHWPDVPNQGDMTQFEKWGYESGDIDVLVGGTPCQSFSVAGMRGGLADSRGNLALTYMRMVDQLRPQWTVWENVPGVLSSAGEETLVPSSGRWLNSGIAVHGECWTLKTLESHKDAEECFLSDVLQETGEILPRYYLSPVAAAGILKRAERRKKHIPEPLRKALQECVDSETTR